MDLFQELNEASLTIVIVTHEHDIAGRAHRIVRLRDGRIELAENPPPPSVGGPRDGASPPC
jgi:predicted ABC-type transport system involved in lysophospholipase L1 biosynthesis ATPase subunit